MTTSIHTTTSISNYAGFWLRLVAHVIDICILTLLQGSIYFVGFFGVWSLCMMTQDNRSEIVKGFIVACLALWIILLTLSNVLYFAIFESSKLMATPGKLALGIIVIDSSGNQTSFWRALGRNAAKALSYLLIYIGFIMAAFTQKKQALHDILADCLVVKKL